MSKLIIAYLIPKIQNFKHKQNYASANGSLYVCFIIFYFWMEGGVYPVEMSTNQRHRGLGRYILKF